MTTMSEDRKFFAKPRVRFSQTTNVEENPENLSGKKTVTKRELPKIKSITSVKTPVKIVSKKQPDNGINTNVSPIDDTAKKKSRLFCDDASSLLKTKCDHTSQDHIIHKTDNEKSLASSHNVENVKADSIKQTSEVNEKSLNEDIPKVISTVTCPTLKNDKDSCNVLKPKNNVVKNSSNRSLKDKLDEGKENKNIKGLSRPAAKPSCSRTTINSKKKANVCETNEQKSKLRKLDTKNLNKPYISNIEKQAKKTAGICSKHPQKNLSTKSSAVNVMPCYKYAKVLAKNKSSPVKKFIVRDIVVPNVKASVELGVPKKHSDSDVHKIDKDRKVGSHATSSEKLSHPEYNSIMCIANKLNEVKKEKIVTDIEHLPTTYKKLINEKTSSALDFPLNEVIYKNLVDLSINEKQFPCKIMRSRDPQPRQKDLVPKLSDFFTPESMEEYYTSMCIKPRSPDITEHWNAFRISDKICEWKNNVGDY